MEKGFVRRLLKDTAFTSLGTACTVFFHFLSVVILSRFLEKEALGLYFLILAVVHMLTVLGGLGLDLTLVKFLSSEDSQGAFWPVLSLRIVLVGILAVALVLVGGPALAMVNAETVPYAVLMALIFSVSSLRDLFYHALQGLRCFRTYAGIQVSSAFLRVLLIGAVIWGRRLTLQNLLWIETAVPLFCVVAQLFALPLTQLSGAGPWIQRWKGVLRFGIPLYMNNVLTVIMDRANVLLMGALLTLEGVAVYEIAGKIPAGLLRIFRSFIVVYFPNLSRLHAKGEEEDVREVVQYSLTFSSLAISLVALGIFLFRETIMEVVFSKTYLNAGMALFLLTVNFLLRALTNLMGYAVVSAGFASVPVKANTVSSLLLVAGGLILIPTFGVNGAIASLFIMNVASQAIFYRYLLKAGIHVRMGPAFKPFSAAMVLCALYHVVEHYEGSVVIKLLTLAVYAVVCLLWIKEIGRALRAGTKGLRLPRPSSGGRG